MNQPAAPKVSRRILGWFRWYIRRFPLRKSFHTVCVAGNPPSVSGAERLVVFLNHSSWWDPLTAMFLAERLLPERTLYAPFDEEALRRYPIFEKLGFFGVDQTSRRGAVQFLQTARAVLDQPGASLWMTPEGRFVDVRDVAVGFEPGLAHLAERLVGDERGAVFLPLAIEYAFWEERLPEALCRFGEPIRLSEHAGADKPAWDRILRERLRETQHELAELSIQRNGEAFRVLLGGEAGVGGAYEPFRWLNAKLRGWRYRAAHGDKLGAKR